MTESTLPNQPIQQRPAWKDVLAQHAPLLLPAVVTWQESPTTAIFQVTHAI